MQNLIRLQEVLGGSLGKADPCLVDKQTNLFCDFSHHMVEVALNGKLKITDFHEFSYELACFLLEAVDKVCFDGLVDFNHDLCELLLIQSGQACESIVFASKDEETDNILLLSMLKMKSELGKHLQAERKGENLKTLLEANIALCEAIRATSLESRMYQLLVLNRIVSELMSTLPTESSLLRCLIEANSQIAPLFVCIASKILPGKAVDLITLNSSLARAIAKPKLSKAAGEEGVPDYFIVDLEIMEVMKSIVRLFTMSISEGLSSLGRPSIVQMFHFAVESIEAIGDEKTKFYIEMSSILARALLAEVEIRRLPELGMTAPTPVPVTDWMLVFNVGKPPVTHTAPTLGEEIMENTFENHDTSPDQNLPQSNQPPVVKAVPNDDTHEKSEDGLDTPDSPVQISILRDTGSVGVLPGDPVSDFCETGSRVSEDKGEGHTQGRRASILRLCEIAETMSQKAKAPPAVEVMIDSPVKDLAVVSQVYQSNPLLLAQTATKVSEVHLEEDIVATVMKPSSQIAEVNEPDLLKEYRDPTVETIFPLYSKLEEEKKDENPACVDLTNLSPSTGLEPSPGADLTSPSMVNSLSKELASESLVGSDEDNVTESAVIGPKANVEEETSGLEVAKTPKVAKKKKTVKVCLPHKGCKPAGSTFSHRRQH